MCGREKHQETHSEDKLWTLVQIQPSKFILPFWQWTRNVSWTSRDNKVDPVVGPNQSISAQSLLKIEKEIIYK